MAVVEQQQQQTTTTTTTTTYVVEEDREEGYITTDNEAKLVEWPPKDDGKITKSDGGQYSVKYSAKSYDNFCDNETAAVPKRTDVFKPNKLKADDRWKPTENKTVTSTFCGRPKRIMRNVEDILHENGPAKHTSYHIPPGTTRTRKAHEVYSKHLKSQEEPF